MQEKRIQYYDSLGNPGRKYLHCILEYLQDEHLDKKKCPIPDLDQWDLVCCTLDTPRQHNFKDCGVFKLMFIDLISVDAELVDFTQDDVDHCRQRIALSILDNVL